MSSNTPAKTRPKLSLKMRHNDLAVTGLQASSIAANMADEYDYEDELSAIYTQFHESPDHRVNLYDSPTTPTLRTTPQSTYYSHTTTHPLFHGNITFKRRFFQTGHRNELNGGGWEQNGSNGFHTWGNRFYRECSGSESSSNSDSDGDSDSGEKSKVKTGKTGTERKQEKNRERKRERNIADSKVGK